MRVDLQPERSTVHDYITLAAQHGARFALRDGQWWASAHHRGRALPLFAVIRDTQAEAAQAYCEYIHLGDRRPPSTTVRAAARST
jgi:hypothetical protein